MKSSYTLETSVYQLVTYKKCKMAEKAHTLFYKRADKGSVPVSKLMRNTMAIDQRAKKGGTLSRFHP